jgi:hypothetical protein
MKEDGSLTIYTRTWTVCRAGLAKARRTPPKVSMWSVPAASIPEPGVSLVLALSKAGRFKRGPHRRRDASMPLGFHSLVPSLAS